MLLLPVPAAPLMKTGTSAVKYFKIVSNFSCWIPPALFLLPSGSFTTISFCGSFPYFSKIKASRSAQTLLKTCSSLICASIASAAPAAVKSAACAVGIAPAGCGLCASSLRSCRAAPCSSAYSAIASFRFLIHTCKSSLTPRSMTSPLQV